MAVLPPFSTKPNISSPTTNRSINRNKHFVIVFCALLLFCLQLTSTAKTNGKQASELFYDIYIYIYIYNYY